MRTSEAVRDVSRAAAALTIKAQDAARKAALVGARRAGRTGIPGPRWRRWPDPNETLRHEPGPCEACGADLVDALEVGVERRQVFDLPR
jgi:hypothetical protein